MKIFVKKYLQPILALFGVVVIITFTWMVVDSDSFNKTMGFDSNPVQVQAAHVKQAIEIQSEIETMQLQVRSILNQVDALIILNEKELVDLEADINKLLDRVQELTELIERKSQEITELFDTFDYVVDWKTGLTGTGYTNGWYRLYKSGWVEQGGDSNAVSVTLPIKMLNKNYSVLSTIQGANVDISKSGHFFAVSKTTTTITRSLSSLTVSWEVKGMAA